MVSIHELFEEIEKKYDVKVLENDEERKTVAVCKNNEESVFICCLLRKNLLRMDYTEYHDRWSNCDYEESFNSEEDIRNIYDDIVFWIEKAPLITEDFYDRYSEQESGLNEFMKASLVS